VAVPLTLVRAVRADCAQVVSTCEPPGHALVKSLASYNDCAAIGACYGCRKLKDYRVVLLRAGYGTLYDVQLQLHKLKAKAAAERAAYEAAHRKLAGVGPNCQYSGPGGCSGRHSRAALCIKGMCRPCCSITGGKCFHNGPPKF
jgi:hypothetical protein